MDLKITQGRTPGEGEPEAPPPPDLSRARQITIGSGAGADLTLVDEGVAPLQLRLTRRGELWWLYDLEPERGAQRNGETLRSGQLVQQGDRLSLGEHELQVVLDEAEQAAARSMAGAADPGLAPAGEAYLRLETGEIYSLARDSFLIGKGEGADLQLGGWNAPAQAAVIVRGQEGHHLINLAGSKVFHQSKPVELRVELKDCDRLEIRGLYGIFHLGAPK